MRFAGPRAPAALFAQLLFWTDLFVLTRFTGEKGVGIYSSVLRTGQVIVLFLTSVNLMFSPYVADLYNRGERDRLDDLFKRLTRWTLSATLPIVLLLLIAPDAVLRIFGGDFTEGQAALTIIIVGQLVNISTGSVGFVLIMVGRTGWDLGVYLCSFALDLALAFWLCPRYGIEGAAIANAITFGASNLARLVLVRRFVGIQPYDRNYARLIVPAAVAAAVMWLVHAVGFGAYAVDLLATGGAGALAYLVAFMTVGLAPDERRGLATLRARIGSGRHAG
jgi:O-antigen/teichoic acid export membrane protein